MLEGEKVGCRSHFMAGLSGSKRFQVFLPLAKWLSKLQINHDDIPVGPGSKGRKQVRKQILLIKEILNQRQNS